MSGSNIYTDDLLLISNIKFLQLRDCIMVCMKKFPKLNNVKYILIKHGDGMFSRRIIEKLKLKYDILDISWKGVFLKSK